MGLLVCILRPSGLTHGGAPCSFLLSLVDVVSMVPNLVSSPLSAWQANFSLEYSNLPLSDKVAECSVLFEITCRVLDGSS
jgi:hypothetical protein